MALTGGQIALIAVVCVIAFALLVWLLVFVVRKRQRDAAYFDRCSRILRRYGKKGSEGVIAKFPYAGATFVRAPAPGQQLTARELQGGSQDFVLPPSRSYDGDVGTEAERKQLVSMNKPIDPGSIDPRLYSPEFLDQDPSSPSSGRRPPQVFFSVEFDHVLNILRVYVDQARFLRPKEQTHLCDPYCTVTVLPGGNEKQSQKHRKTVDPLFQENFSFEVAKEELREKTVQIKFFNFDPHSRDECIGTVVQRLDEFHLDTRIDLWRKIHKLEAHEQEGIETFGDMLLRIGYLPSAEKLTVVLLKARNLPEVGIDLEQKPPDPYIRVSIYHEGTLLKKKKTSTKKRTLNPTYNQAINFAVPLDVLPQVEIQFSVVHETGVKISRAERKEAIGYLEIGPHSSGAEFEHWRDLMSNKPQARWHHLKAPPNGDTQSASGHTGVETTDGASSSQRDTS